MKLRSHSIYRSLTLLAGLILLGGAAAAHAQTTVIDSLPYTIYNSGTYVLNSDLNSMQTSGNLITIATSNVTIDFQNHYIAGAVNNTAQSTRGIYALERSNVTIKNGTIAFCNVGVNITGNGSATTNCVGLQVDNMRVTYCYNSGIYVSNGVAARITNCQVSQSGYSGADSATGIYIFGPGTSVQGNVISNVIGTNTCGISSSTGSFARQNTISNAKVGISGGKYQDNLFSNCVTAFTGGTDAGGNN